MTSDDLTIVVPLWRRTAHVERVHDSALHATPGAQVLFVASELDYPVVDALLEHPDYERITMPGPGGGTGDYAKKINAGYRASARPFVFTGADDIVFTRGWYEAARAHIDPGAVSLYGEGGARDIGVVGTNDECNPRTYDPHNPGYPHSTHSLVARWYADQGAGWDGPCSIYHEGYPHDYVDDELVQTAILRGSYAHAVDAYVPHLHLNVGAAPDDETYAHGRAQLRHGRLLYRRRQRLWGGGR